MPRVIFAKTAHRDIAESAVFGLRYFSVDEVRFFIDAIYDRIIFCLSVDIPSMPGSKVGIVHGQDLRGLFLSHSHHWVFFTIEKNNDRRVLYVVHERQQHIVKWL